MSGRAVLAALSALCGSSVRYFVMSRLRYMGREKKVLLCVGSEALFFVKKDLSRLVSGGELMLNFIEYVVEDTSSDTQLLLYLNPREVAAAHNKVWQAAVSGGGSEPLLLLTEERDTLTKWIEVAWCSDFSLRRGRLPSFPRYLVNVSAENNQDLEPIKTTPHVQPFIGTQQVCYDSYTFFLYKDFEDRAGVTAALQTGCYVDSRGVEVQLLLLPPVTVSDLAPLGRGDVRHVAAGLRRALLDASPFAVLVKSSAYIKKMNLSDDPAQWTGWQLWVRNEEANIISIVLRRMYLPPLMDVCQDLIFTYKVSHEDQREYKISGSDLQREAEFVADSLAPEAVKSSWLKEILQTKLDALVLQDEHYKWLYMNLRAAPKWLAPAKVFLKSLLAILQREGVLADDDLLDAVGTSVPVVEDPMLIANEMIRQGEGVDPSVDGREIAAAVKLAESEERVAEVTKAMHAAAISYHRWAMRVAAYLAYCVHEGILGTRFSLADLSEAVGLVGPEADKLLRASISFLLHLRPKDFVLPWSPEALKTARDSLKRRDFTFNHKPFMILLECGYIAKLYPRHEEEAYIEMLRALLTGANTVDFKVTLCKQILKATGGQTKNAYDVLYTIIPALVQTMRSKDATSSGSSMPLLHLCAASLVNLSAGDSRTKEILLEGGVHTACVSLLKTKEASVVQAAVMLLLNLTKLVAHRQKFLAVGGLYPIVDLLMHNYASDFQSKQRLLSTLMGVVGQLANDEDARTDMTERFPVVDFVLFGFHNAGDNVEYKTRILFALKQLSAGRWQVQQRVGKHVISSLVADLRGIVAADFVTAALSLLQVLASYKPNCFDMKMAGIQDSLSFMLSQTKLDILYHRVANLQERINAQTKYDFFSV